MRSLIRLSPTYPSFPPRPPSHSCFIACRGKLWCSLFSWLASLRGKLRKEDEGHGTMWWVSTGKPSAHFPQFGDAWSLYSRVQRCSVSGRVICSCGATAWPLMLAHLSYVLPIFTCRECQALHVLAAWGFLGQPIKAPALPTALSITLTANQYP